MSTTANSPTPPIPILLLKSPSPTPASDAYTLHLTPPFRPTFVPVLSHTLLPDPLIKLLLTHFTPNPSPGHLPDPNPFPYGALIFTSQRSVAAFASALNAPQVVKIREEVADGLGGGGVRLYVVGPATGRALRAVRDERCAGCGIHGGEEAGSGEVLARIMLGEGEGKEAYSLREREGGSMKPALFLVGEKRRDIIPRMLMDPKLPEGERIQVDEMEVYKTGELEEFEFHFTQTLTRTEPETVRWVVVFSPTAGEGMLRGLGWLDKASERVKACIGDPGRRTFVACIGPTTRNYLVQEFGFEPDVIAQKPSPQGVKEGIESFMKERAP
ncbi:hypothetical protein HO133_005799 [Letharia lupina]|uniref:Tetrapyrrole biosynthesis uroporphyrinogen III synthase domain-containing protein n=1 Tax=Letharia lupina TaxID=560253 RepID=A0A8H6F7V4_9LECA|nr:uncharacterized protein HO133_005799 [Letharia lupina]KAF6218450.1 hypothetical protein HO133_005799 [Letharia lupina]